MARRRRREGDCATMILFENRTRVALDLWHMEFELRRGSPRWRSWAMSYRIASHTVIVERRSPQYAVLVSLDALHSSKAMPKAFAPSSVALKVWRWHYGITVSGIWGDALLGTSINCTIVWLTLGRALSCWIDILSYEAQIPDSQATYDVGAEEWGFIHSRYNF